MDKWHTDAADYVVVIILSDLTEMEVSLSHDLLMCSQFVFKGDNNNNNNNNNNKGNYDCYVVDLMRLSVFIMLSIANRGLYIIITVHRAESCKCYKCQTPQAAQEALSPCSRRMASPRS